MTTRTPTLRLQAQDERLLAARRRKPVRRARQVRDEITARRTRRMRPFIYGEER